MLLDAPQLGGSEVSAGERTYPANYTSAEHTHQSIEIIYVLVRRVPAYEVNGQTHVLTTRHARIRQAGRQVRHKTGGVPAKTLMVWVPRRRRNRPRQRAGFRIPLTSARRRPDTRASVDSRQASSPFALALSYGIRVQMLVQPGHEAHTVLPDDTRGLHTVLVILKALFGRGVPSCRL